MVAHLGLPCLFIPTLHRLEDFYALEGANLPDMSVQGGEPTADSDHNRVRFDQENSRLRPNHVLALIRRWSLLHLDKWQEGQQCHVELSLCHDLQELIHFDTCGSASLPSFPCQLIQESLLVLQIFLGVHHPDLV